MKFTVGSSAIVVTDLGRIFLSGNSRTHTVKLVFASTGADVPNGSVTISMTGGTAGQFKYVPLANPITLSPNTAYFLVCQELLNGDQWATSNTIVSTTTAATCNGSILPNSGTWQLRTPANRSFGPVNFKYSSGTSGNILPAVSLTSPVNNALFIAPANVSLAANATDSDGTVSKVEFFRGNTLIGASPSTSNPYSFSWNNVVAGNYTLTAKATDNSGGATSSSAITIKVDQPPAVSITSPANNAAFSAPANFTITATASDSDGTVSKVEFFNGLTLLGTDTASPYSFAWNNVVAGGYTLTAKATDNNGAVTTSSPVNIVVNTVSGSGSGAPLVTSVTLGMSRNDFAGWLGMKFTVGSSPITVTSLGRFVFNGNTGTHSVKLVNANTGADVPNTLVSVSTANSSALQFKYVTLAGQVTLPANASYYLVTQESSGGDFWAHDMTIATIAPVVIYGGDVVSNGSSWNVRTPAPNAVLGPVNLTYLTGNMPPIVSITTPPDGTVSSVPANFTLTAAASDSDGIVTNVSYYEGANLIGSATVSPYTIAWNSVGVGSYKVTARAADDGGLVSTSSIVNVTVSSLPNVPPTVNITSPADGAVFTAPANIPYTADAADSDGTISQVDFFQNGIFLATDSTGQNGQYSIPWNAVGPGAYALTVQATDNAGAPVTSSQINITVNPTAGPPNDMFANAQVINGSSGTVAGTNVNATAEPGEPFHADSNGGVSVWYQWTATTSSQTIFDTLGSSFDTLLAVYIGPNVSSLIEVASNNDIDATTSRSRLSFTSVAGTTYFIAVDGLNGAQGTIALNWSQTAGPPPPASDGFAAAQVITGSIGTFNNSTANATKEPGEPNHAGDPGGASVWYAWTAPTSNSTVFDTFGSSFDTLLAVYTGNSVGALTPVASNNDLDNITKQSRVSFTPVAGTTYFIAVDGFGGASGNFVLSWTQSGLGFLPDLVIRAGAAASYQVTNLTFISTDCAVVEGLVQAGTRKLLVFTTETRNVGSIDWYEGNPANNPDFVWAPCHAHYHFNNYMRYQLLDINNQPVAVGLKVGFCLTDSLRWDANANATHKYHCGLQGIQKGWGDVYTYWTAGQWVDVTGLPDGNYTLQMTVNPQQRVQESDYSNNTVLVPIIIGQAPPANDNFARAQIISGGSGGVSTVNTYGTKEPGEPNHAGKAGGHSIWYSWTAPSSQTVNIDTLGSGINTLLAVYTGTSVSALTLVASNDDLSAQSTQSRVIFNPVTATTYMIAVDGNSGVVGNITLNWAQASPPANDNFVNAQVLSGLSGTLTTDNLLATKETGEPNHAGPGTHSIWFKWTPNTAVSTTIDTIGSNFDTLLAVYTGTAVNALTAVVSNDDIGGGVVVSRVTFTSNLGTTYRIAVDGYNGAKGNVTLNWNQATGGSLQAWQPTAGEETGVLAQNATGSFLTGQEVLTGGFQVTVRGRPGDDYALEVSTDLTNWTYLHTVPVDALGLGLFIDRAKAPGRVNLLDPWCGKPNDRTYLAPIIEPGGVYYRAVRQPAAKEIIPLKVQPNLIEQ